MNSQQQHSPLNFLLVEDSYQKALDILQKGGNIPTINCVLDIKTGLLKHILIKVTQEQLEDISWEI